MFKALTQRLSDRLNGNEPFSGAVFDVGAMPKLPEPAPRQLSAEELPAEAQPLKLLVLTRLTTANPETEDLKAKRATLLADASLGKVDLSEVDECLSQCEADYYGHLRAQHRAVREQGRKQSKLCAELSIKFTNANMAWNAANEKKARALEALDSAITLREHVSRWASDAEIQSKDAEVEQERTSVRLATEEVATALAFRNDAANGLESAQRELSELAALETQLRASIERRPYIDAEFGLEVPPR